MKINFTKSDHAFASLEKGDVFYLSDDEDDTPYIYMVIDPVYGEDSTKTYAYYNCVCLDLGLLDHMEPDASVKLCKAIFNVEG